MATNATRLELLSKINYDTWCMQVEALLEKNDLWDYVNGVNARPPEGSDSGVTGARWRDFDKKAKADLILSIQPSELKQIRGCMTSREVWLKLESIYASKGPARKATLLKQLILQRMPDGGDVKEHIANFFDAVDKLEAMNVQIHGDLLAILLLYSLPPSYDTFQCAIETRDELPSAEVLKIKIIEESAARIKSPGNVVAALASGHGKRKQRSRRNKKNAKDVNNESDIVCYKCRAPGHKSNVCPESSNSRGKPSVFANIAEAVVDESYLISDTSVPVCYATDNRETVNRAWILDSGCTTHLCGDPERFLSISESPRMKLNLASQACAEVRGKGTVRVSVINDDSQKVIEFKDTLYVPDLRANLISVAKIANKGHVVTFRGSCAYVTDQCGKVFLTADRRGDLYYLRESVACANAVVPRVPSDLQKWHERFGHLNLTDLMNVVRDKVVPAVSFQNAELVRECDVCLRSKMTTLPFPKNREPCKEILKIVHSDVVGPFRTQNANGARWFVTFIDDCSRWCEVYFLRQKSGVLEAFKLFKNYAEKQTGKQIKSLQSDNGREYYKNAPFDDYLSEHGIERRLSVPRTPQQNGVAERKNRTLLDMARCLMVQSSLPPSFWSEAIATACHIRNRCPTSSLKGKIPYEVWTGELLNVDHLRTFGSKVMVLNKDPTKDKLQERAFEGTFVGYPRDAKGYRVWVPGMHKTIVARDVRFLEGTIPSSQNAQVYAEWLDPIEEDPDQKLQEEGSPRLVEFSPRPLNTKKPSESAPSTPEASVPEPRPEPAVRRAPGRPRLIRTGSRGRPKKLYRSLPTSLPDEETPLAVEIPDDDGDDDVFVGVAEVAICDALESEDCEEWKDAIESEVLSLVKNDTWDIVQREDNQRIIGCRLVLTNKHGPDGNVEKRKARLVAKGYSQRFGVDYHQTFAPVARLESLRILLALAVQFGWKIWQFDVVTAYLNGYLEEELYMKVPDLLEEMLKRIIPKLSDEPDVKARAMTMLKSLSDGGDTCRLKRALYGLRQAGRQWYTRLSEKLTSLGLTPVANEPCLFCSDKDSEGDVVLLLIYVDDILVASRDIGQMTKIKQSLMEDFKVKDLGLAEYCLGLEIAQGDGQIELSQTGYILGLLKQYNMDKCNPVATPSELNSKLVGQDAGVARDEKWPYRELIGALMYLSVATRPDIANTVSKLAQFTNEPQRCHWLAAKRVLRYLAGSSRYGLVYTKTDEPIIGYSDADWGGCTIDRRSYTGYAFLLSGAAITWKSQKQRTVALSTTEAEYVSLSEAAKEALYLRALMHELKLPEFGEIVINIDNQGALCLANDPVFHARTKHIDLKHHFVRGAVKDKKIDLAHVPTEDMVADVLTKPLPRVSHVRCLEGLGFDALD